MWPLGAKGWASAWAVARLTRGVFGDSQPVQWDWEPDLAGLSVCGSGLGGVGIALASGNAYVRCLSGGTGGPLKRDSLVITILNCYAWFDVVNDMSPRGFCLLRRRQGHRLRKIG